MIEIVLASAAAAVLLVAIYGLFQRALKMRDDAMARVRDSGLRIRASKTIRNDLQNGLYSGGLFASTLEGDSSSSAGGNSGYPGYLTFTTTTGKDTQSELYGDVQQVEYYIVKEPAAPSATPPLGGDLVRVVTRDLLDSTPSVIHQQQILASVQSLQVAFYDGTTWQPSWQLSGTASSTSSGNTGTSGTSTSGTVALPQAIRVDIQQAPSSPATSPPPPLEILVPWTSQPFATPTPST